MGGHYNLVYLKRTLKPIDDLLTSVVEDIGSCEDPDGFGLLDQYEQYLGIGFVICQTFLSSVHQGKNKGDFFSCGPFHSNGQSYAHITNACANYWKHNEEWDQAALRHQTRGTISVFEGLSVDVWKSYPLSEVFHLVVGENGSFIDLLGLLDRWSLVAIKKAEDKDQLKSKVLCQ